MLERVIVIPVKEVNEIRDVRAVIKNSREKREWFLALTDVVEYFLIVACLLWALLMLE